MKLNEANKILNKRLKAVLKEIENLPTTTETCWGCNGGKIRKEYTGVGNDYAVGDCGPCDGKGKITGRHVPERLHNLRARLYTQLGDVRALKTAITAIAKLSKRVKEWK